MGFDIGKTYTAAGENEEATEEEAILTRAAIYARVSTGHQDPDNQVQQLRQFAVEHGYELTQEYVDQESGRNSGRAAFQQTLHDARRRRFG